MKNNIVILHGWGLAGSTYKDLKNLFPKEKFSVYAPDLPGFGNEKLPSKNLYLNDYVEFVRKFLLKHNMDSALFIGHSFGGRIAAKYGYLYPEMVEKIIFTGVPIIRHMGLKKRIGYLVAIVGGFVMKIFPGEVVQLFRKVLYKSIGEYDYYKAKELRGTLRNIVNEDLTEYVKSLKMPVLLVWGKNDTFTPSADVEKIKKLIPHAKTNVINNVGHRLPYENPDLFMQSINTYL